MRKKRKRGTGSRNSTSGAEGPAGDSPPKKAPEISITMGPLLARAGLHRVLPEPHPATLPPPGPARPSLVPDPPPRPTPDPPALRAEHSAGEFAALNQAYRGVEPIRRPKRGRAAVAPPPKRVPRAEPPADDAARERLSALVAGGQRFHVERDEAWVQGIRVGVAPQLLRRLASARFEPEARIDLHGLRRDEARRSVRDFVRMQHRRGARYLLIVVGKGNHSEAGVGVLGDALVEELTGGVIAPLVAAFTSAHVQHGGTGAVAVQLS
jgi:DNA-nicking Smr family endonuclease